MRRRYHSVPLLLVLALSVGWPVVALAQITPPAIHIHALAGPSQVTDTAGLPALAMQMDFTLLDSDARVMPGIGIASATLDLEDGSSYPAPVADITSAWSVVMLVDTTRDMYVDSARAAFQAARSDAIDFAASMPDGTNLAVMTFNNKATLVEDFTTNRERIQDALLKRVIPENIDNHCLYDGAYEAVRRLATASGRRALVILTSSGNDCARLPDVVVELARQNQVQIFAVGLRGYSVTLDDLEELTVPTGGLVELRDPPDVNFAFENIVNGIKLQRRATTTFYPRAGTQNVRLSIVLADNTVIYSQPQTIVADRDYESRPQLAIRGIVTYSNQELQVNLVIVSPRLVDHIVASVISVRTGEEIANRRMDVVQGINQVSVGRLQDGEDYQLVLSANDRNGRSLAFVEAEFKAVAQPAVLQITRVELPTVDDSQPAITVTLQRSNLEGLAKFKLWLVPEGSQVPVPATVLTLPLADTLTIPVDDSLTTGKYQTVVVALTEDDSTIAQAVSGAFTYIQPDSRQRMLRYVRETPAVVGGLAAMGVLTCVGALAVMMAVVRMVRPARTRLPKSVDLVLPEVKRRAAPVSLEDRPQRPPGRASNEDAPAGSRKRPAAEPRAIERPADAQPAPRKKTEREPIPGPAGVGPRLLPACLTSHTPATPRLSANIARTPFKIGRGTSNDLVVPVDNRMGVSGTHASITFENGRFYLVDEKSSYGTLLNGRRIEAGKPTALADGDNIGLGPKVTLQFRLGACP
jgi:hypothetical protein